MRSLWPKLTRNVPKTRRATRNRLRAGLEALEARDVPAFLVVTSLADAGPGSLRDAIQQAEVAPGASEIDLDLSGTIRLNSALPDLKGNLKLTGGPGADLLEVENNNNQGAQFRIFHVAPGATVEIDNMTIGEGVAPVEGGDPYTRGGGVYNEGNLTLNNVRLYHNAAVLGGGIYNAGALSINGSTLDRNVATIFPGAAYADGAGYYGAPGSVLSMNTCTVSLNYASAPAAVGAGLYIDLNAYANIGSSTIANNYNQYNSPGSGPGVAGAGIFVDFDTVTHQQGNVGLYNTIVADNYYNLGTPTYDVSGPVSINSRWNLIGNGDAFLMGPANGNGGNRIGSPNDGVAYFIDLGPLQDNGGHVPTQVPQAGSSAIDAGDIDYVAGARELDQRAHNRVVNGRIDIGATEYQPPGASITLNASPAPVAGQTTTLTATVTADAPGSNPITGMVTFYDNDYDPATFLRQVEVVNGQAVLSDVTLPANATIVAAQYEGDAEFSGTNTQINVAPGGGGGGGGGGAGAGLHIVSVSPSSNFLTSLPGNQVVVTFDHPIAGLVPDRADGSGFASNPFAVMLIPSGPDGLATKMRTGVYWSAPSGVDDGDLPVPARAVYHANADGTSTITLTPNQPLSTDLYLISVGGLTDTAGDPLVDGAGNPGNFYASFDYRPSPLDLSPLRVTAVTTHDGSVVIGNNVIAQPDTIGICFNKPLDTYTANADTIQLLAKTGAGYTPVAAAVAYSPTTDTAYLTPEAALVPGTTYAISVSGDVTDDQGFPNPGVPLGQTFNTTFQVSGTAAGGSGAALSVVQTNPFDGTARTNILGYGAVTFNKPIDPSSLGRFSAMLIPQTGGVTTGGSGYADVPVNAKVAFNPNTNQLVIVPTGTLRDGVVYLFSLGGIKSQSGDALASTSYSTFLLNVGAQPHFAARASTSAPLVAQAQAPQATPVSSAQAGTATQPAQAPVVVAIPLRKRLTVSDSAAGLPRVSYLAGE